MPLLPRLADAQSAVEDVAAELIHRHPDHCDTHIQMANDTRATLRRLAVWINACEGNRADLV